MISNTRRKLEAVKYHLLRMRETQCDADPHVFEYELDAFLSAARSVTNLPAKRGNKDLWYLEKEFGQRPGFQQWYDEKVNELAADTSMKFINDERATVVHYNYQSVHTRTDTKLTFTDYVTVSDSLKITKMNAERTTEEVFSSPSTPPPPEKPSEMSMERIWYFDTNEIPGDKAVITVCEQHIHKLEKLLDEVERL